MEMRCVFFEAELIFVSLGLKDLNKGKSYVWTIFMRQLNFENADIYQLSLFALKNSNHKIRGFSTESRITVPQY